MIALIKHKLDTATVLDFNKALRSVALYAWISAGILFVAYLYFVGAITFSVIKEKGLKEDLKTLVSKMGEEEQRYLVAQKTLTESYALESGFVNPAQIAFALPKRALAWNVGR